MIQQNNYIIIEVPPDAYDIKLSRDEPDEPTYISYLQKGNGNYRDGQDLPDLYQPECYEIISRGNEASEEVAKEIVEDDGMGFYRDYENSEQLYHTPTPSLHSLIRSKGLKPEQTLILKSK